MENFRLRVFRAVARHRNFRIAAEELLLTQPAVTQQIKALEAELDTALFERGAGRVELTAAGAALLPYAESLAAMALEAQTAVAQATGAVAGEVTVGASQTIGQYLLPRLIAGFMREFPKANVRSTGGNTQTVLEALAAHAVQIALIEGPAMRKDVHVEPFLEDHMVCVVPADHEWAGEDVALTALAEVPLVMREMGSGSRRVVEQALEAAGIRPRELRIGMTVDSTEGLLTAVEAGLGVGFVSRWAVRNQLALGTLRVARIKSLRLARMFSLVTVSGPEPTGAAGAFRRFVLESSERLADGAAIRLPAAPRRVRPTQPAKTKGE
jgi:DNA-binding transcriptional LysR family regulator